MADEEYKGQRSSTVVGLDRKPYVQGGGEPPGGDPLEPRVKALEDTMLDIKVTLARMEERMGSLATKSDMAEVKGLLSSDISEVKGILSSKVDYKWFGAFMIALVMLLLREEIAGFFT